MSVFEILPKAPYGVERLDPASEAGMTFGYYEAPTRAKPVGSYRYNGSKLANRPLVTAGPLIYHELIPGHHFHLARQQENESLHIVRRELASAGAFNEGWGNYVAGLARENGLLEEPYDRYGWALLDVFVATRLVVDTEMNHLDCLASGPPTTCARTPSRRRPRSPPRRCATL